MVRVVEWRKGERDLAGGWPVEPAAVGVNMANESKYSLPRVMTVKELSEYLRVHPSTIYKLLRRGELPGFRIGTDWRFNAEVIDRWCLERNMKAGDPGMGS